MFPATRAGQRAFNYSRAGIIARQTVDSSLSSLLTFFHAQRERALPLALATVVATEGSTYRKPGARMLIGPEGASCGLLSGGCLEGDLAEHAQAVIEGGASGALLWSLRFHHRGGGFYWHSEPAGARLYKAYHWPGFDSGRAYEERQVLELTRRKAYEIRGIEAPELSAPAAPTLLTTQDAASIS